MYPAPEKWCAPFRVLRAELTLIYHGGSASSGIFTSWREHEDPIFPLVFLAVRGGTVCKACETLFTSQISQILASSFPFSPVPMASAVKALPLSGSTTSLWCLWPYDSWCRHVQLSFWSRLPNPPPPFWSCFLIVISSHHCQVAHVNSLPFTGSHVPHNFSSLSYLSLTFLGPADSEGAACLVQGLMDE